MLSAYFERVNIFIFMSSKVSHTSYIIFLIRTPVKKNKSLNTITSHLKGKQTLPNSSRETSYRGITLEEKARNNLSGARLKTSLLGVKCIYLFIAIGRSKFIFETRRSIFISKKI